MQAHAFRWICQCGIADAENLSKGLQQVQGFKMGRLNDMRGLADTRNPMMKSPFESQSSQEKWNHGPSLGYLRGELKESPEPQPFLEDEAERREEWTTFQISWILDPPLDALRGNLRESPETQALFGRRGMGPPSPTRTAWQGYGGLLRLPLPCGAARGGLGGRRGGRVGFKKGEQERVTCWGERPSPREVLVQELQIASHFKNSRKFGY